MISMDSKVQSMDSRIGSLDSKVEQLLNVQTFLKNDFHTYKHAIYEKMNTVYANVASSQTSLETRLFRQFTEHQLQISSDLDFVKLQLAELFNHLKEIGDAKKREGGQISGCGRQSSSPRGGPSRGEGGQSSRPSYKRGEGSSSKKRKWF
ncbi:anaphase-promoting complex subunit 1-like [Dorcoceras hygrometricum]|uniref:Anaphase-promoting complex subunit 1-like n=1 Tax=Dorcoceras hygrometricum TaxID=472368 RepID=A0A2Z7BKQ4_9LAMI|nr:anaphase-promoting complex subunit 1-like [Dorcoceras hygrometricum]